LLEEGRDLLWDFLLLVFEVPDQNEGLARLEIGRDLSLYD